MADVNNNNILERDMTHDFALPGVADAGAGPGEVVGSPVLDQGEDASVEKGDERLERIQLDVLELAQKVERLERERDGQDEELSAEVDLRQLQTELQLLQGEVRQLVDDSEDADDVGGGGNVEESDVDASYTEEHHWPEPKDHYKYQVLQLQEDGGVTESPPSNEFKIGWDWVRFASAP